MRGGACGKMVLYSLASHREQKEKCRKRKSFHDTVMVISFEKNFGRKIFGFVVRSQVVFWLMAGGFAR